MPYTDLLVYRSATTIYDFTVIFCERFLTEVKYRRLVEQMVHAARSGKQNIAEGNAGRSLESNLKLTDVARSSFKELLEDYKDFLRQRNLSMWDKNDPRVINIRQFRENIKTETNLTNLSHWSHLDFYNTENFANLMICLCFKETYLLDQLIKSTEDKFIKEGGFRENLFKKRKEFKNKLD